MTPLMIAYANKHSQWHEQIDSVISAQYYKRSMIIIYDSWVELTRNLLSVWLWILHDVVYTISHSKILLL